MKIKDIILRTCCLTLTVLLMGCGESSTVSSNEADISKGQEIESTKDKTPINTDVPKEQQGSSSTPTQQNKPQETVTPTLVPEAPEAVPMLYDRLEAWDDFYQKYGSYYSAVQIEDMFLYSGMMGSELGAVVAASKDTKIETVAMGKLVKLDEGKHLYKETQRITYYRGDEAWFDVYVRNISGSLQPFEDCVVSLVLPCSSALEYCRFFDGTYTVDSLKKISYKDYDGFAEKLSSFGYTMSQTENKWIAESNDVFSPASLEESIYWTKQEMSMEFEINLDSGLIEKIKPMTTKTSECKICTRLIPEDFDWADEEFLESMKALCVQNFKSVENSDLLALFREQRDGRFMVLFRNNATSYFICEFENVGIDSKGHATELSGPIDFFYFIKTYSAETYAEAVKIIATEWEYYDPTLVYEYLDKITISGEGTLTKDMITKAIESSGIPSDMPFEVVIEEGFEAIDDMAFMDITNLRTVLIPDSVCKIGDSAFRGCTDLRSITLPKGLTNINWCTFLGCSALIHVEIPQNVTVIGLGAFSGCSSLKTVDIPSGVNEIHPYAFEFCTELETITLPTNLMVLGASSFAGCEKLTTELPELGYHIIDDNTIAFAGLVSKDISDVSDGSYVIPEHLHGRQVVSIAYYAFAHENGLKSIVIPDSLQRIASYAFYNTEALQEVIIPNGVTRIANDAFAYCYDLNKIVIPDSVTFIDTDTFEGSENVVIYCKKGSYAEAYAKEKGIPCIVE